MTIFPCIYQNKQRIPHRYNGNGHITPKMAVNVKNQLVRLIIIITSKLEGNNKKN